MSVKIIEVDATCPFEHSEFPHCKIVSKDKDSWCSNDIHAITHITSYDFPPDWCPLRKGKIVVRLPKEEE